MKLEIITVYIGTGNDLRDCGDWYIIFCYAFGIITNNTSQYMFIKNVRKIKWYNYFN